MHREMRVIHKPASGSSVAMAVCWRWQPILRLYERRKVAPARETIDFRKVIAMKSSFTHFALVFVLLNQAFLWTSGAPAQAAPLQNGATHTQPMTPAEAAVRIDQLFEHAWQQQQIKPASPSSDEEFVRRIYLDLAGRIPAISEVREFLEKGNAGKRQQLVERLLDNPAYVRHFTIVWRNALIPAANSQAQFRALIPGFDAWLWKHLAENTPYDEFVREIITAPATGQNGGGPVLGTANSPDAFFAVRELKPENLATGTSRSFLGVRLDCAQCHDHPFDKWRQDQFWNMAAFYSGFQLPADEAGDRMAMVMQENLKARSIRIPSTGDVVPAVFLTGVKPDWLESQSPREVLANWITAADNPWFAKMAANRLWAQFMGHGLVQPVDDFSDSNPPTHPEVLQLLADQLVANDFDLRFLIRAITDTRVYQTSSIQSDSSQDDPTMFARAPLRGLTPEQFFDSLAEAVGFYQPYRTDNPFVLDDNSARGQFLQLYRDDAESPLQRETTILQALAMMNGTFVSDATSVERSQTLRAISEFPLMNDQDRLDTLFLATVSRHPTRDEQSELLEYLKTGGTGDDSKQALANIFWALLNSSEFLLNH